MEKFPQEIEKGVKKVEQESGVLEKLGKLNRSVAFTVLLGLLSGLGKEALAQTEMGSFEDIGSKIESLKKDAASSQDVAISVLKERGRTGHMEAAGSSVSTKELTLENGVKITVGFGAQGAPAWSTYQSGEGGNLFFDNNADGSIDRFIVNKNEEHDARKKQAFNEFNALNSLKFLVADATNPASQLERNDVKVYDVRWGGEGDNLLLTVVDFESGEFGVFEGAGSAEDAQDPDKLETTKMVLQMQGMFTEKLSETLMVLLIDLLQTERRPPSP